MHTAFLSLFWDQANIILNVFALITAGPRSFSADLGYEDQPRTRNAPYLSEKRLELVRQHFEPHLDSLDLSAAKIAQQTFDELKLSLERVNDAISHPENFGVVKLKASASSILAVSSEAHFEIGIMPMLLERK